LIFCTTFVIDNNDDEFVYSWYFVPNLWLIMFFCFLMTCLCLCIHDILIIDDNMIMTICLCLCIHDILYFVSDCDWWYFDDDDMFVIKIWWWWW